MGGDGGSKLLDAVGGVGEQRGVAAGGQADEGDLELGLLVGFGLEVLGAADALRR